MLAASCSENEPLTSEKLTPAFSNTAPSDRTRVIPPPPEGCSHRSSQNRALPPHPSSSSTAAQICRCSPSKYLAAAHPSSLRSMSAIYSNQSPIRRAGEAQIITTGTGPTSRLPLLKSKLSATYSLYNQAPITLARRGHWCIILSKGKIQVGNSRTRCTVGSEGIGAVRARTHEEQCGGQLLPSWNPSIIFLLIQ